MNKYTLDDFLLNDAYLEVCRVDLNLDPYNDEQITLIMKPIWAPEDFYRDGEVSLEQALRLHNLELIEANISDSDRIKALRLAV